MTNYYRLKNGHAEAFEIVLSIKLIVSEKLIYLLFKSYWIAYKTYWLLTWNLVLRLSTEMKC